MRYSIRSFQPATYIMASQKHGTIYVGVTSDLVKRVYEHKNHTFQGFTDEYTITNLVYFECHETMGAAIAREKALIEVESGMEDTPHRRTKSRMEGLIGGYYIIIDWIPV